MSNFLCFASMVRKWCSCVPPRVKYESEIELREACFALLEAYVELTHRVVGERIRTRVQTRGHEWTEMDRLMLGIATFDEITEQALALVLTSTKANGVLYAHDLNTRVMRCINRHNFNFFHETTSFSEVELHASLSAMLTRVLITSHQSHYHALLDENFKGLQAWDGVEWLVCPLHRVREFEDAIRTACTPRSRACCLHEDAVLQILGLLGFGL